MGRGRPDFPHLLTCSPPQAPLSITVGTRSPPPPNPRYTPPPQKDGASPMKVICDRGALLDAINLVSGAVAARTPRVQLTCVKLAATKADGAGELTLSATDAEIALKLTLTQVDVQQPGEALIPA